MSASPVGAIPNVQLMRPMADTKSAPISQASEPVLRIVRADTGMSASNRIWRPDDECSVYRPCDEAIDNNVRVLQLSCDLWDSHDGVPVTSKGYDDAHIINAEVRVQGASPPADRRVRQGRPKGRTSSTPAAPFGYTSAQRSNNASSRSTSSLHEKSKSGTTLAGNTSASKSNLKFDSQAWPIRRSTTSREDSTSPSSRAYSSSSRVNTPVVDSAYESNKVELSAAAVGEPVVAKFDQSNYTMAPRSDTSTRPEASRQQPVTSRQRPTMSCQRATTNHQRPLTSCQQSVISRQPPVTSRERLVKTPNYGPKFECGDSCKPQSTAICRPYKASSTTKQRVASIKATTKKYAYEDSQHCNCSTRPFNGDINTDASCKVSFPRSNSKRIICAQFPTGTQESNFPSGKTTIALLRLRVRHDGSCVKVQSK